MKKSRIRWDVEKIKEKCLEINFVFIDEYMIGKRRKEHLRRLDESTI